MSVNVADQEPFSKPFLNLPSALVPIFEECTTTCMELYRTDTITDDFAKLETRVVEMTRKLGVEVLGSVIEQRDDGASSLEREGYSWHRLHPSRASLTCQLGKVAYRRSRSRRRGERKSICPVDESLGLLALFMVVESPPRGVRCQ